MRYSLRIFPAPYLFAAAGMLVFLAACGPSGTTAPRYSSTAAHDVQDDDGHGRDGRDPANPDKDGGLTSGDHSGWWCVEHGVPEGVCTRCDNSLVEGFKKKSDWCNEHSRPDSQCFICHPELEAKFAARYEAKFGKKPPKPTDL